jgi:hypothetical protein
MQQGRKRKRGKPMSTLKLMEKQYEELCEMIRGSSPNWTHKETVDRCAQQVDALIALEDSSQLDKNEISQHQRDWMDKNTND